MFKSTTASQKQAPSESALVAAGSSTAAPDNTQELSPEESYGSMLKWFQKLGDDHDMTILDFFKSLHQATHPDTRDPSQCTTEQQAWMDEQAAEVFTSEMMDCLADAAAKMRMQDEAEVTGKSVEELALERVQPIIEAEMEALENCGHFRSSKNGSEADDFSLDKIQPLLEELAPNLFDISMGAVAGAREYDEVRVFLHGKRNARAHFCIQEQPQGSTSTEDDDSEVSNARVSPLFLFLTTEVC